MKCLHMYFILLQICWSVKTQKGFGCRSNLGVLSKGRVLEGGQQQLMERNMCVHLTDIIFYISRVSKAASVPTLTNDADHVSSANDFSEFSVAVSHTSRSSSIQL